MDNYNELPKSTEHNRDNYMPYEQTAGTIEALQSVLDEKQRLLTAAMRDLAEDNECKYCANIEKCSAHHIERNLAYGGCAKWQWRGVKSDKTEVASIKQ